MGTTIDAQFRQVLATFAQSTTPGPSGAIGFTVGSLDRFGGVRFLAATSGGTVTQPYSFRATFFQGHSANVWLATEAVDASTSALYEFDCAGLYGRLTITLAASAAFVQGAMYGLPIQ